ncbi:hypothetical protein B5M09_006431 [Aphanomyces astaci]|uniref:Glycosyl transferase CAP10 domain-containing protein n=1 Tax=Aphanomyces astaci TaxID=112090 RepID=A0A3R7Z6T9_APHAT|nr:hypothetical protein B5M09_006431 [Aphanomyces astaci]
MSRRDHNDQANYSYGASKRGREDDNERDVKRRRGDNGDPFRGCRGIFAWEDEPDPTWKAAVESHGGGVPKFATKGECEEFVQKHCAPGSNPDFRNLQHIFTMLVTWTQIAKILIPAMEKVDKDYPFKAPADLGVRNDNRFHDTDVEKGIKWRMDLPFHRETNRESTMHTLKYLFFHMRCGILVMIRNGRVVLFAPFANKDYENNWSELDDACKNRNIPDCEFFINKRDYPHLKSNLSEPYGFLFDRDDKDPSQDLPLEQFKYNSWKKEPEFHHMVHPVPYLDAQITAWNLRDKKIAGHPMTFLRKDKFKGRGEFTAGKEHYIPMYEQSKFKYILYVEGHCAANRYAFLMRLGSVILKVSSKCVADEMWYTPLLVPMEDHVPIQEDLSDLAEKIAWCRAHDAECREMAARAKQKYEAFVSKEGIYDYMELITTHVAQRYSEVPTHWDYVRPVEHHERDPRKPSLQSDRDHSCVGSKNPRLCTGCEENKALQASRRRKMDEQDAEYHSKRPKVR